MAYLLTLGSVLLVLASMPLSLMFVVKVVQVRLSLNPIMSVLRHLLPSKLFFTLSLGYPFVLGVNCATKLSIQSHKKGTNLLIYFDFFELSHDHSTLPFT